MPFRYPQAPHVRRHGPEGYADYDSFRPWLRDEFAFRCVYCLVREQWRVSRNTYAIDHFLPQILRPDLRLRYENLLYSCTSCNAAKGDQVVPNPCDCMLDGRVVVHEDGTIEAVSRDAQRVILVLGLDDAEYCEFRRLVIDIAAMALVRSQAPEVYTRLMKYPDNLPDLSTLRPPENRQPEGIEQSYFSCRQRGELPETY